MLLGKMQINSSVLDVRVAEQPLDRADIGAGFEHVNGIGMPQGVITVLTISFPLRSAIAIIRATAQRSNLFAI
jgi:hypothetical protein